MITGEAVVGRDRAWTPDVAATIELPSAAPVEVDRIAFVLHAAELLNHYREIWAHLDPGSFEIVVAAEEAEDHERIGAFADARGYTSTWVGDVLAAGRCFRATVSNHVGSGGTIHGAQVLPLLARRHVRLMYALGKDAWNFASWNEQYDLILCWGPYQAGRLGEFDRPRVVQVGYPRFDRFWRLDPAGKRDAVAALGGDPDRRTLLWLPTWSGASSIDAFAETIAELRDELNVLLKVHPFTAAREPERMARLADLGLASTADPIADNLDLLFAADVVAADYGGSAFAAIHTDRDLVLLNTPGVGGAGDAVVGADSLDVQLREWILSIEPGEAHVVRSYLADGIAREQQRGVRERLGRSLFAPFRGCAGEVAATTLRHLRWMVP